MPNIKAIFEKAHDFKIVPVSGAVGGITAQGDLNCNLYYESTSLPLTSELNINEESGALINEKLQPPTDPYINRTFLVGLTIKPRVAKSLAIWLLNEVEKFESKNTSTLNTKN